MVRPLTFVNDSRGWKKYSNQAATSGSPQRPTSRDRERPLLDLTTGALQKALALENQSNKFAEIMQKLQQLANKSFRFTDSPIFPQKAELDKFVEKSIFCFPEYFGPCRENISLLHHLQRYAACYLAYESGYFAMLHAAKSPRSSESTGIVSSGEKPSSPATSACPISGSGQSAIKGFLAECQPPMSHLFEAFQRAHITGEIHLQALARQSEEDLRTYIQSSKLSIAGSALEVEALVQAFVTKKSPI
ncbi:hypothetical protein C8R47DRAFT_485665 [Mycena vitilis]|nr:hypothetical protein C8R47DRAFT_485665 [Mycena vitilis]